MVEFKSQVIGVNTVDFAQKKSDNDASQITESNFHLVTGEQWRRQKPEKYKPLVSPVSYVLFSYTMRDPCFNTQQCIKELRWMQKCQMFKVKLGDIRYNFIIGTDASVYEIRGWTNQPTLMSRLTNFNSKCLYIGFMGSFKAEPPNPRLLRVQTELLKYGVRNNYITPKFNIFSIMGKESNDLNFMEMETL